MVLATDTLTEVKDYIAEKGLICAVSDFGLHVYYKYPGIGLARTFVPYGYDVNVNHEGFPEVLFPCR